jgi:hypothetical protein
MTEPFTRSMRNAPTGSNAKDPGTDRLGAYSDGGELRSPQEATDRDSSGPTPAQPDGIDAELTKDDEVEPDGARHRRGPFVDRLR